MKKALIVYAVIFTLTVAIPAAVCFLELPKANEEGELVNIFRQCVSLFECYC